MRADGREWVPRDPTSGDEVDLDAEKAVRVLAATRPVFLDCTMLLLRSAVLDETIFVFTRVGAPEPADVDVEPPAAADGLPPSIAAALAARDANAGPAGGRPITRNPINKYN